jgi:FAD/FMN-containing dehydrogenase
VRSPPISSTVNAFRLMKADGEIVRCTRAENSELFSLALGGYGLFGVILDAELRVVPNERYESETSFVAVEGYPEALRAKLADPAVEMAYGRLCVAPGDAFLREGLLTTFRASPCAREEMPGLDGPAVPWLRRAFFRAQIGSDSGKTLRWTMEKKFGEQVSARYLSRNDLLYEAARVYTERNADRIDVIHESFVPPERFAEFLDLAREALAKHPTDLMNVTVRSVDRDDDTFLRYADGDRLALVMLFDEERSPAGDRRIQEATRALVDAVLACGGRYYLPYRGDATREQFERAYPMAREWAERKRRWDPENLFSNAFFERYASR